MVAPAYNDPDTIIGAIFGTGCNAAYMASISDIKKLSSNNGEHTNGFNEKDKMAINCEYGAFDNAHRVLPLTRFGSQIDAESPPPGEKAFEKLSAGLYLGEIFRLVLVELADQKLVYDKQDLSKLRESYSIDTAFLSRVEENSDLELMSTCKLFEETLHITPSIEEAVFVQRLAELIAIRGARLCACGVAAICLQEGITKAHVAADGSVANKYPKLKTRWIQALGEILDWRLGEDEEGPIRITSAEDGSGVGCAVVAAMELERRKK